LKMQVVESSAEILTTMKRVDKQKGEIYDHALWGR